jgi:hypothetical protein
MKNDLVKMILLGVGLAFLLTCGLGGLSLVLQQSTGFINHQNPRLLQNWLSLPLRRVRSRA